MARIQDRKSVSYEVPKKPNQESGVRTQNKIAKFRENPENPGPLATFL